MTLPRGQKTKGAGDYTLHSAERSAILLALNDFRGTPIAKIAQHLGVSRYTLNRLIRVRGFEQEMYRSWPKSYNALKKYSHCP